MKRLMLSGLVAFSVWQSLAYADDTDIYLRQRPEGTEPYLMLTFDYRNDMASSFCNGRSTCQASAGGAESPLWESLRQVVVQQGGTDTEKDFSASNIQALVAVLRSVFQEFDGIYVGLMMPNVNKGGSILRGFKLFEEDDHNKAKKELEDILLSIPANDSMKGSGSFHAVSPKELHYEFWSYLNGEEVALGHETVGNFPAGIVRDGLTYPLQDADPYYSPDDQPFIERRGASFKDKYISPFAAATDTENPVDYSCVRIYEVHATSGNDASGNGDANLDDKIRGVMEAPSAAVKGYAGMVSHMANNDMVKDELIPGKQTLKSWYIQVGSAATNADDWARIMGTADQDNYMAIDGKNSSLTDIEKIMKEVFIEALSESSTFVSASVPVNVFNRIQTLDNFYIALFEANSTRRWPGNLKKLKMVDTSGDGRYDEIVDAINFEKEPAAMDSAFLDADGRIRWSALTFWTDPSTLPPPDLEKDEIDGADGRSVARGGAGQRIPGFLNNAVGETTINGSRQVYVEPANVSSGSAVNFDTFDANLTGLARIVVGAGVFDQTDPTHLDRMEALFGTRDVDEAIKLMKWGRGLDVDNEDDNASTLVRPWILGDAIHSRPLALNYGATPNTGYSEDNPNIRLFMGTNDGFFHVFEDSTAGGQESGKEVFSFIPRESLPVLKKLRDNTSGARHPYGVDGEPVGLVVDNDLDGTIENGDEVYVYVGMRRGGKSYYALDASDPTGAPKFKWKISKTSGGDFDELGWTFSTPRVVKLQYGGQVVDALIFAGGYDLNKDKHLVGDLGNDTEGNAIYIVNARTGDLIWKAAHGSANPTNKRYFHSDLDHSIPSSVATLDSNANGIVDRAYVGDTGGVVWRIDLPEGRSSNADHRSENWKISKLADLGGNTEADDRRFFHQPDVVQTKDAVGNYDGILIESGDRASPLENNDQNYLYLIKDRVVLSGATPAATLVDSDLPDTTECEDKACSGETFYDNGWKIKLNRGGAREGEKGLASPLTIDGQVFFTTYAPVVDPTNTCEPIEGLGYLYVVNLKDGTAVYNKRDMSIGPGIPPQVTALGDSALIIPGAGMLTDPDGDSNEREKLVDTDGKGMYIIYWREPGQDSL